MSTTAEDRNIERRRMEVTAVEMTGDHKQVRVTASHRSTHPDVVNAEMQYVTSADKAPRVGIIVNVTIEAVR